MKSIYQIASIILLLVFVGCQQPEVKKTLTAIEKEGIKKEVVEQFNKLVASLNQKDAAAWSQFYSKDEFISATVATDNYNDRNAWVDLITKYFTMRKSQSVQPIEVRITPLAIDLALLTSEENSEMLLDGGKSMKSKHVFTMIWKKSPDGWKILHSHESWIDK